VEETIGSQALDSGDRAAGNFVEVHLARKNWLAVDQHRAGATLSFAAARLRAGKAEAVTKETDELAPGATCFAGFAIYRHCAHGGACLSSCGALGATPLSKLHGPTAGGGPPHGRLSTMRPVLPEGPFVTGRTATRGARQFVQTMVGLGSAGVDEPEPAMGVAGPGSRSGFRQAAAFEAFLPDPGGGALFVLGNLVGALRTKKASAPTPYV
jgi:hypothetical protein